MTVLPNNMRENEVEITQAKESLGNAVQHWVTKLVELGIPRTEIENEVERVNQRARFTLETEMSKREGKKLAGE